MADQPRYAHDCERCSFLGQMDEHDVYYCPQDGTLPTIVFRWADEPAEYRSAFDLFDVLPPALQAKARECLASDRDVALILRLLKEAGGELHYEHLEHRYDEEGGTR
jgi:hypothetical protein